MIFSPSVADISQGISSETNVITITSKCQLDTPAEGMDE